MIPIKDILPSRSTPVVMFLIIACNVAVWFVELAQGNRLEGFISIWGFIPARILLSEDDPEKWLTPITSMFMHGGWAHIIGNMWFLWIFGDNVEDAFGHFGFLLFYLLCGIGAAAMQFIISIHSPVPMVGASGAISGVLGAYACFYPRARVVALVPVLFFLELIEIPAIIFITLWFLMQLMSGCMSIGINTSGGIAFWAHIGGFLYGWLIARSWKKFLSKRGMRIYSQDEDRVFTFKRRSGWW